MQTNAGTQEKLVVSMKVGSRSMDDMDFSCDFYTTSKRNKVTVDKSEMQRVDKDNYIAIVDTSNMKSGEIHMKATVDFDDADAPYGVRREKGTLDTGETIEK